MNDFDGHLHRRPHLGISLGISPSENAQDFVEGHRWLPFGRDIGLASHVTSDIIARPERTSARHGREGLVTCRAAERGGSGGDRVSHPQPLDGTSHTTQLHVTPGGGTLVHLSLLSLRFHRI